MPDHIVVREHDLSVACLHCGRAQWLNTPCAISVWLAMAREFERLHQDCPKPIEGVPTVAP